MVALIIRVLGVMLGAIKRRVGGGAEGVFSRCFANKVQFRGFYLDIWINIIKEFLICV